MTKIVAIESTAHTFDVGIFERSKILERYRWTVNLSEGFNPSEIRFRNMKGISQIMTNLKPRLKEIGCVYYSSGPGIGSSLETGYLLGKLISYGANCPLMPINHSIAHFESGISKTKQREESLIVYLSGGNSQFLRFVKNRYIPFIETADIGLGNCIDKLCRYWGIHDKEELLTLYDNGIEYPIKEILIGGFLYFGAVLDEVKKIPNKADSIRTFLGGIFRQMRQISMIAGERLGKKYIVGVGGVFISPILRKEMEKLSPQFTINIPHPSLQGDNCLMIYNLGMDMGIREISHGFDFGERAEKIYVYWEPTNNRIDPALESESQ